MRIDYGQRQLTMSRKLPAAAYATELPLRMHRLATVRGTVNGSLPASFVVDTGGEVISISGATADLMSPPNPYRRIPLKVYGTSGWDKEAFLMPFVDLEFNSIHFSRIPVVVLNLRAPSALLGYQLRRDRRAQVPEQAPGDRRSGPKHPWAGRAPSASREKDALPTAERATPAETRHAAKKPSQEEGREEGGSLLVFQSCAARARRRRRASE